MKKMIKTRMILVITGPALRLYCLMGLALLAYTGALTAEPINLYSVTNWVHEVPNLAVYDDHVAVMWREKYSSNRRLYTAISSDGGETFGSATLFPYRAPYWQYDYTHNLVYGSDGVLHVTWSYHPSTDNAIRYARSTDYGATWNSLSNNITGSGATTFAYGVAFAVNGTTLDVINYHSGWGVFEGISTNGGLTWTGTNITAAAYGCEPANSYMSSAAFNASSNLFAVADNRNMLIVDHKISGTWGYSWITTNPAPTLSLANEHAIATFGDDIFVVYSVTGNVYFTKSTNNASTWSTAVQVDGASTGEQVAPVIGVDSSGKLHVAWQDNRSVSATNIYYAVSSDGTTWAENPVWASASAQITPDLVLDGNDKPNLVWIEDSLPMYYVLSARGTLIIIK